MRHSNRKTRKRQALIRAGLISIAGLGSSAADAQSIMLTKFENFNINPNWDGHNNRFTTAEAPPPAQFVTQNFGFSAATNNAGGTLGEMGGSITPTGEPAFYAKAISTLNLNTAFSASGRVKVDGGGNSLLGFFNSNAVNQNEWRTPNSVALRLYGRGSYFESNAEYGTSKWRVGAGGIGNGSFTTASSMTWSISYDPNGAGGNGLISATMGAQSGSFALAAGHKADGATFDRFGLLNIMKSYDSPGGFWVDNLVVNGATTNFGADPGFQGMRNQGSLATYTTDNVRFRFNFGYSTTSFAGGTAGEIGGDFFRGDSRQSATMAYYGGQLDQTLSLDGPLHADGKVTFKRGVSDSTVHIGFFHSADSVRVSTAQAMSTPENFVGATIEGPSEEGFYFYPSYNTDQEGAGSGGNRGDAGVTPPRIYPDDTTHNWTLDYDPTAAGGQGRVTITLDGQQGYITLKPGEKSNIGAHFNRFGFVTPHIDGNGQTVFVDDVTYTTSVVPGAPAWNVNASGDWNNPSNWDGSVPNGIGAEATLGGVITLERTIFANTPITLGTLKFDNLKTYVLTGAGSLTMQVNSGNALVNVIKGTHKINLPLTIASNTTLSVASGATLKLSDPVIINSGKVLSKTGSGSVVYESTVTVLGGASFDLQSSADASVLSLQGKSSARLAPHETSPVRVFRANQLSMSSIATFDLNDNAAAIKQLSGEQTRELMQRGQIISSMSDSRRRLGYGENSSLGLSQFHGQPVDLDSTLIAFTYAGDSNLDGVVDVADLAALATHWQAGAQWIGGDFDYNGIVDVADLGLLATNWQARPDTLSLQQVLGQFGLPSVAVPEPAGASLVVCTILLGASPRLRQRCRRTR